MSVVSGLPHGFGRAAAGCQGDGLAWHRRAAVRHTARQASWKAPQQKRGGRQTEAGSGRQREGTALTPAGYVADLVAYEKRDSWAAALWVFEKMRSKAAGSPDADKAMLRIGSKRKQLWRLSLSLYAGLHNQGVQLDQRTQKAAVVACSEGKQWEQALWLLRDMQRQSSAPDVQTFSAAISSLIRGECQSPARETWLEDLQDEMQGVGSSQAPSAGSQRTGPAWAKSRVVCAEWQRALSALEGAKSLKDGLNSNMYHEVIIECAKSQQHWRAMDILHEMQAEGFRPNAATLNAVIDASARNSEPTRALVTLSQMLPVFGVSPSFESFQAAMEACKQGGPNLWLTWLRQIQRWKADDGEPLAGASPSPPASQPWALALQLVDYMASHRKQFDEATRQDIKREILGCLVVHGHWEMTLQFMDAAARDKPDVAPQEKLFHAIGKQGSWEQMLQVLGWMDKQGVKVSGGIVSTLAGTFKRMQGWQQTLEILEVDAAKPESSSVMVSESIFNAALSLSATHLHHNDGCQYPIDLLDQMLTRGLQPDLLTYNVTLASCVQGGRVVLLERVLQRMREAMESSSGPVHGELWEQVYAQYQKVFETKKGTVYQSVIQNWRKWLAELEEGSYTEDAIEELILKTGVYTEGSYCINLHGMPVRVALAAARMLVESALRNPRDVVIITGRGRHSKFGGVLRKVVARMLSQDFRLRPSKEIWLCLSSRFTLCAVKYYLTILFILVMGCSLQL
ncbi:unnamed protein product [Polarella glacialis]|uniref:Smr domain-containing protein n=1 Tax=Polarella glacialis TaxID=89957 RepID=A0A813D6F6_POLGL|nr:unnamed protein product [Polarella glacialis]